MAYGRLEIRYPDGRTVFVDLRKRQMVMGRASDADIPINDTQVSRRHALLLAGPDGVRLVDAGSANGTYLGNTRLPAQQPVPLPDGGQLRLGQTLIRFIATAGATEEEDETQQDEPPGLQTAKEFDTAIKAPAGAPPGQPPAPPSFTPPAAASAPEPASPPSLPPPGVPADRSSYLSYLPPIFAADDFLGRFLLIFESILSPLSRTIDNLHFYFDPHIVPAEMLPWLASWLGLVLDERWPEAQRRALIRAAVELYEWRGTRRGLKEFLQLYTGYAPEIEELGIGRRQVSEAEAWRILVRIRVPDPDKVDRAVVEAIIDAEKPAHIGYALEIVGA
jgi:phage tail-like protein